MGFFAETEGKDTAFFEKLRGFFLDLFIVAHPDRPQAQDRNLPGIPVLQPVKPQYFIESTIPVGVPAFIAAAVLGRGQQGGEYFFRFDKLEKIRIPDPLVVVVLQFFLALVFKERDGFLHYLPGLGIQVFKGFVFGVQQHGVTPYVC